jgi:hypothetical protein
MSSGIVSPVASGWCCDGSGAVLAGLVKDLCFAFGFVFALKLTRLPFLVTLVFLSVVGFVRLRADAGSDASVSGGGASLRFLSSTIAFPFLPALSSRLGDAFLSVSLLHQR